MGLKVWGEEYYVSPLIHVTAYAVAATGHTAEFLGKHDQTFITAFKGENSHATYAVVAERWAEQGNTCLLKLEDPGFFNLVTGGERIAVQEVRDYAAFLKKQDFGPFSNVQLYEAFEKLFSRFVTMNVFGHVINTPDFNNNIFSDRLTALLEGSIRASGSGVTVGEAFSVLLTPNEKSALQKQDEDFFVLLKKVQESPELLELFSKEKTEKILGVLPAKYPGFHAAIDNHVENYDWLQYHFDGPMLLKADYFVETLQAELSQGVIASEKLEELRVKEKTLVEKQKDLAARLRLAGQEAYWIDVAKNFLFLKGLRKETVVYGQRCAEALLAEIARRLGLSVKQLKYMTRAELKRALEGAPADVAMLNERIAFSVFFAENGVEQFLVGEKAEAFFAGIEKHDSQAAENVRELKGTTACPGLVRGIVKFIAKAEDMAKMNQGDILISFATNPNLVPAMKKAGAIVTDEGGITCHAAIVSRELGIPCVVGTKIVTKAFKDGDLVEVDATKGIIRKIV